MSGAHSLSHATALSTRCLIEFTFQVATRMAGVDPGLKRVVSGRRCPRSARAGSPPVPHGACFNFADARLRMDMLGLCPRLTHIHVRSTARAADRREGARDGAQW